MTILMLLMLTAPLDPAADIRAVIAAQSQAWNRGDLDGYLAPYWHSPELTFFSGAKISQGWEATRDRYRKRYQSEGHEMGQLEFSDLQIEILGPKAAFVRGAFRLTTSDGKNPHGIFTLIFRKFPGSGAAGGWKVVHDSTAAAE